MLKNETANRIVVATLAATLMGGAVLAPIAAYAGEAGGDGISVVSEPAPDGIIAEGTPAADETDAQDAEPLLTSAPDEGPISDMGGKKDGKISVTVAEGRDRSPYVPIASESNDCYAKAQTIVPADMLSELRESDLKAITFHADASQVNWGRSRFRIFLQEVSDSYNTRNAFYDTKNATFVYEGSLEVAKDGTVRFPINKNDFRYHGGNLLISIQNVRPGKQARKVDFYGIESTRASVWGSNPDHEATQAMPVEFIPTMTIEATEAPVEMTTVSISVADHAKATVETDGGETVSDGDQIPVGTTLKIQASADDEYALSVSCDGDELSPRRDGTYICDATAGATEISVKAADTMPRLVATLPATDKTIGLIAVVRMPEAEGIDWSDASMGFDVSDKTGRHVDVKLADATDLGDGRFAFVMPLSSIEMAQPVKATLTYTGETHEWDGLTLEDAISKADGLDASQMAYAHAVADLGFHAQTFLSKLNGWELDRDYAKMGLHYTEPGDFDQRTIREDLARYESHTRLGRGLDKATCSLVFGSNISVKVNLYAKRGTTIDAKADFNGRSFPVEQVSDTCWTATIDGLTPDQLTDEFQVTGTADGYSFEVRSCGLAYANSVVRDGRYGADGDNAMFALWNLGAASAGLSA